MYEEMRSNSDDVYLLALDEGTTSARAIIFNKESEILGLGQHVFPQIYPKPGWVEQNPEEIWKAQVMAIRDSLKNARVEPSKISAIGITNQRETVVLWDKSSGKPICNAIVWQCRRTAGIVEELRADYCELFKEKTGLVVDSYFSGPKVKWLLENVPVIRDKASKGKVLFGTIDSFLIWKERERAGLAVGCWNSLSEITSMWKAGEIFEPTMCKAKKDRLYRAWKMAVKRSFNWAMALKKCGLE
jgi:glycerol kinase